LTTLGCEVDSSVYIVSEKTRTAIIVPSSRPTRARSPLLVMLQGPEIGRRVELDDKPKWVIGRDADADLQVDSDLISRQHACILRLGRHFHIDDMGSTNGTYVNGEKLAGQRKLQENDSIKVGKVVFRYTEDPIEAHYHGLLVEQARVDQLTRTNNKKSFQDELGRAVRGAREGTLALVLFDIDHFKRINDTWGHSAGDSVLAQVADVARSRLPADAFFARVGGEEFAVLLPGSRLSEARACAERIRAAMEKERFRFSDVDIPVTVSLGAAELAGEQSPDTLYQAADERLYAAKHGGRNRVC
jgi:diguanylate cyclase (GGDEF)-like protein